MREYGVPERIRTDNGNPFSGPGVIGLSRLSLNWVRLGIVHERIQRIESRAGFLRYTCRNSSSRTGVRCHAIFFGGREAVGTQSSYTANLNIRGECGPTSCTLHRSRCREYRAKMYWG
jgi:hypothetical protein